MSCNKCGKPSPIFARGLCRSCYLKAYHRGAFRAKNKNCPKCNAIMPSKSHTCSRCGFNTYPSKKRNCPKCGYVEFRREPAKTNIYFCSVCHEYAYSQRTKRIQLYETKLLCPTCGKVTLFTKIPFRDYLACKVCGLRYSPRYLGKSGFYPFFDKGKTPSLLTHSNKQWRKQKTKIARQKIANLTTNGTVTCYDAYYGYGKKTVKKGSRTYTYSGCKGRLEFHEIHGIRHNSEPSYILGHLDDFIQLCHSHHNKRHTLGIMFGSY